MMRVTIVGRGKVGTALARAARRGRLHVRFTSGRRVLDGAPVVADLVVIAMRDADVAAVARALAPRASRLGAAAHCAGALGIEALEALARAGVPTAAAHPLLSFSGSTPVSLRGGALVVEGAPGAVAAARRFAAGIGMNPVVVGRIDRATYHAAAALAANGAAALASAAATLLAAAGIGRERAGALLGPLLRSVGDNVTRLGPERALSGPVRRGDVATIQRHLAVLDPLDPAIAALYRMLVQVQIPIAQGLSDRDEPGAATRDYTSLVALTRR
jgi:predicted short-subunit dehydrogenase-like oxidoreductase (DUF2520 family)